MSDRVPEYFLLSTVIVNNSSCISSLKTNINEDATGVINITVDGKNYSAPIDKGIATFKIDNLASGSYDVSASYDGDENYLPGTNTSSFNVEKPGASASVPVKANEKTKANSTIIVNANNIAMGDSEKITVRVNEDATGSVTITVDGKTYSAPIDKGLTTFKIDNLASGSYDVLASYDGDENYLPGTNTSSFSVGKHNAPISVSAKDVHHRTGTTWKAYPMYDFAHGQSDYFEGVTHSLCTLEFVPHRPLYDLFVDWVKEGQDLNDNRPHQYEFNKLNLSYTLMSKRNLLTLVKEKLVNGWDDPRMPTICGFRRRGYSPESIHKFIDKIGYTTYDALNEFALLESALREDLNSRAIRVSAVVNPVKLVITNYPEGQVEELEAINNPEKPEEGSHFIEFSRELWMEREDFMEDAPKKYFRMTPGQEVRLKNAYIVKCTGCKKNEAGEIVEVYCEYDPNTKSGMPEAKAIRN